jgi:hypothetical protein
MTPKERHDRACKANDARNAKLTAEQRSELTRLGAHRLWGTCACGCKGRLEPLDRQGRSRRYLNGHNRATMIRKGRPQSCLTAEDFRLALGNPPRSTYKRDPKGVI